MTDDSKEWNVELSEQVKAAMERDPKINKLIKDFVAAFHQANDGVERGQYKSQKDGVESILGATITHVDPDDLPDDVREEFEQAVLKHKKVNQ